MKRSDLFIRLTAAVLFLAVASYIGVVIYNALMTTYITTDAVGYSIEETVPVQGYIIRTETVLTDVGSSTLPIVRDGERVYTGQAIAVELLNQEAIETAAEIRAVSMRIAQLESLGGDIEAAGFTSIMNLSMAVHSGNLSRLDELSLSVQTHIFTEGRLAPRDELPQLRSRLERLEARSDGMMTVHAPLSGTFSQTIDGFEHIAPDSLVEISPSKLEELFSTPSGKLGAGKLVTEFKWYYAAIMDVADATRMTLGQQMTVQLSGAYHAEFRMNIERIGRREGDICVVVFSSDRSIHDVASLRNQRADLVFGTISGIRVPREAIHLDENGATFLYLQSGVRAERVDVEILREAGDGYLVRDGALSGTPLRVGATIIVRANDLYHGKIVG